MGEKTMICPKCGLEFQDQIKVCIDCGLPLVKGNGKSCPKCGRAMVPGKIRCVVCNTPLFPENEPEPIGKIWPRDFLLPIIDHDVIELLRYITRERAWMGCFTIQVQVDGMVARLRREKLLQSMFRGHPEITDSYLAELIAEVALSKGLAVFHKGVSMVIENKKG
jgi:predicted RNA-binding Zn-ribbon protein involved in translation (DUF1610 family)